MMPGRRSSALGEDYPFFSWVVLPSFTTGAHATRICYVKQSTDSPSWLGPDVGVPCVLKTPPAFGSSRGLPTLQATAGFGATFGQLQELSESPVDLVPQLADLQVDRANCTDDNDKTTGDGSNDLDPIVGCQTRPLSE